MKLPQKKSSEIPQARVERATFQLLAIYRKQFDCYTNHSGETETLQPDASRRLAMNQNSNHRPSHTHKPTRRVGEVSFDVLNYGIEQLTPRVGLDLFLKKNAYLIIYSRVQ
jgi:hypothetical protein